MTLPSRPVVGMLHPGAMGAALGAALKPVAGEVVWADAGRSHATAKRAELADLVAVPDVPQLVSRSDLVISICPPHAALDVAKQVAAVNRPVLFLDANAVAPATVRMIGDLLGVEHVVDGGIIGPPAWERGSTVLWLSGTAAGAVAALFAGSAFDASVLGDELGQASALKACFGLQSKALPSLWLTLAEAARRYRVEDELRSELRREGIDLDAQLASIAQRAAPKAWRWAGEMDEAAGVFTEVGLPDGFSRAAAEVYRAMAEDPSGAE
jgi:hypothetical protein